MKEFSIRTEDQLEHPSLEGETMDLSRTGTAFRAPEEEEEDGEVEGGDGRREAAVEGEMECSEPDHQAPGEVTVKREREEDMEECAKCDDAELEEDEAEEKEERDEGEGEGYMMAEAEDLSPTGYVKYESSTPPDGQGAAPYPGSRNHGGKLSCDVCGLACVSINVLLVHKRSHTGERPFHCSQCGASFTQKGNLLRHIKLHSGEKPFKCPMCSYSCRRRDALSGHLRTHSVEKPFKCNHCGRSYKQRSSLEEHRERCHVYTQSKSDAERVCEDASANGARSQVGMDRALLLDRLASNVAKRKSTMPQKFIGETPMCLDLCFNREPLQRAATDRPLSSSSPESHHNHASSALLPPEPDPGSRRNYPLPLTSPLPLTNGNKLDRPPRCLPHPRHSSLGNPGLDSPHAEPRGLQPLLYGLGQMLGPGPSNGLPYPHPLAPPPAMVPHEVLRVVRGDGGEAVGAYMCGHCRVLFLDYVMFTIHMGCHGFRDPLECNVCGHLSRDRYEFSSHIARGEHYLEFK